jgi:hypothetical protein
MKAAMCKEHGVCLLLVPHTVSRAGMASFLKAQLQAHQIPIVTEVFNLGSKKHATCMQPKEPAQPAADESRAVQTAESDRAGEAMTALVAISRQLQAPEVPR